jgi:hypothetical protein
MLICVCLRILASSRIPRYDLGRQNPSFLRWFCHTTPEGRMGKGKFESTKERLVKQFSTWAERHMSSGAKEILIKLVAQAILTYVMGVFKLPAKLCEEMT